MKRVAVLVLLMLLVAVPGATAGNQVVVLTAAEVTSAADIEQAIIEATAGGTQAGTVLLDSGDGPFVYAGVDRSINIMFSNVTLSSRNGAVIANCDDGIFFDNVRADDISVEGITFQCAGSGVIATYGGHDRVTLRQNTFEVANLGIEVSGGQGWTISGNHADAGIEAIALRESNRARVTGNVFISPEVAVMLERAHENRFSGNHIAGPSYSGFFLEGSCQGNGIHGNRVTCARGADCVAVSGPAEVFERNQISGNPVR